MAIKAIQELYVNFPREEADKIMNQLFDFKNPETARFCRFSLNELVAISARQTYLIHTHGENALAENRRMYFQTELNFVDRIHQMGGNLDSIVSEKSKARLAQLDRDVKTATQHTARHLKSFLEAWAKEKEAERLFREAQQARTNFKLADGLPGAMEKRFS